MSKLTDKVSYLKGLAAGMKLNMEKDSNKLLLEILGAMGDMAEEMQYVYNDGELYYFMDVETYDQIPMSLDKVEDAIPYVKEGTNVTVRFFKGQPFSVEAPNFVVLEVTDTEPGFKGDTASNTYKPATLETGYSLQVPLFVNTGDKIRIDTRTGEYMERA